MPTFKVNKASDVPEMVRRQMEEAHLAASLTASERTKRLVSKDSPVDRGDYKLGWRTTIRRVGNGRREVTLLNDAPHAGIIEQGARPHWAPLAPLVEWAFRKAGDLMLSGTLRADPSMFRTSKKTGRLSYRGSAAAKRDTQVSEDVMAFAMAVRRKIATVGQAPRWIMRKRLGDASKYLKDAFEREMRKAAKKGGGKK